VSDDADDFAARIALIEPHTRPRTAADERADLVSSLRKIDALVVAHAAPRLRDQLGAGPDDVIDHLLVDAPPCSPPQLEVEARDQLVAAIRTLHELLGVSLVACDYTPERAALIASMRGGKRSRSRFGYNDLSIRDHAQAYPLKSDVPTFESQDYVEVYVLGPPEPGPLSPSDLDAMALREPELFAAPLPRGPQSMTVEQWGGYRDMAGRCTVCNADDSMWCDTVAHQIVNQALGGS
jgi:hypothetical protein